MLRVSPVLAIILALLSFPTVARAQSSQDSSAAVPRLIAITGVFRPTDGQPPAAVETVTLSVYEDQEGGTPLWHETQTISFDDRGRYSLLLGAAQADGIPRDVFASGTARWLGTRFERRGESEGPRVRLVSVPYALKASDAETLGGRPASDYLLGPGTGTTAGAPGNSANSVAAPAGELPGVPNVVAKYVDASNVGPSSIFESGGFVGVGTSTPFDNLHVRFTNTSGVFAGYAVQNLGNTATSYSGMLFFDQNGALGQFQGFNNVTHEYRINNVAKNGASAFDGTINFMTGSTSRLMVASNGNIGIGTVTPTAKLQVAGNLVADDVSYTAPQTAYYAVSDAAFSSRDGATFAAATGTGGAYPTSSTTFGLVAPVNLPHGATITSVRFVYVDNSTNNMTLVLAANYMSGIGYNFLATHSTTVQTTATQSVDVPLLTPWTVDNTAYSLVAIAYPDSAWSNASMMVRGVIVTYTMPRPAR